MLANELPVKHHIQRSFDRASKQYATYSSLQQRVAEKLIQMLRQTTGAHSTVAVGSLLDLGCGPGANTQALWPYCNQYIALDLSAGMLRQVPSIPSVQARCTQTKRIQADMDHLPLADNSIDLVFSSLAVQWTSNPHQLSTELNRILKPGGLAFISTVLEHSLQPLDSLRYAIDNEHQANTQLSLADWQFILEHGHPGWVVQVLQETCETVYSSNLNGLLRGITRVGADARTGRALTPATFRALSRAYEKVRLPEGLPLHYQIGWMQLKKQGNDNLLIDKK